MYVKMKKKKKPFPFENQIQLRNILLRKYLHPLYIKSRLDICGKLIKSNDPMKLSAIRDLFLNVAE